MFILDKTAKMLVFKTNMKTPTIFSNLVQENILLHTFAILIQVQDKSKEPSVLDFKTGPKT